MGYLFTDKYDKMILERRVQQMKEVETLLGWSEAHFGVTLVGEQRMEELWGRMKEKKKEESSTSKQAEEILGETDSHLHGCQEMQPRDIDMSHMNHIFEREPHM